MGKIFYIADTHFGHEDIITFDNRPFQNADQMTEVIIENWNKVVSDDDDVYVIGDMLWDMKWDDANAIAIRLNGNIHTVIGNHDDPTMYRPSGGCEYMTVTDNNRHVILCHYPMPFYNNMTRPDWYHLYGHVHAAWDHNMIESWSKQIEALYMTEWKGYNVGCMMPYINYTPRTLDEIIAGARKMRGKTI
jgi:calcineurin-like phosphoesterase family protein